MNFVPSTKQRIAHALGNQMFYLSTAPVVNPLLIKCELHLVEYVYRKPLKTSVFAQGVGGLNLTLVSSGGTFLSLDGYLEKCIIPGTNPANT